LLSPVDWYILEKSIKKNVQRELKKTIETHEKKIKSLTRYIRTNSFNTNDIISNRSNYELTFDELNILKEGLQHSIPPKHINKTDIFCTFELIHRFLKEDLISEDNTGHLKSDLSHLANCYYYNYQPTKETLRKHKILHKLKKNKDIVITKPDKGSGVVVLNREEYNKGIYEVILDKRKFKKLEKDLTLQREGQLQRFLRKLKKDGFLNDDIYNDIYPNGSLPARIYGLPKMHKLSSTNSTLKFRPIVSSISTYNYKLAKYLCTFLTNFPSPYSSEDSFSFIKEIQQVSFTNSFMVSYDVSSLFTNIPLTETIDIVTQHIFDNNADLRISQNDLKKLFHFATAKTHFLFNDEYYDQVDGVSMGSPLAPVLANVFMAYHEQKWINTFTGEKPLFYRRYVDDIFSLFTSQNDAKNFFNFINNQHINIKFTMETEINDKLSFLDITLDKSGETLKTSIFRKQTFTGLLTSFNSFTCFSYKRGLIKCLIDRIYKINNTWLGFHHDIDNVKKLLEKNTYPMHLIDKTLKNYLDTKYTSENNQQVSSKNVRYYKLPFIGKFSEHTKTKVKNLAMKYCKSASVKIAFTSFKIGQVFSTKDCIPSSLKSHVIYKFICANCKASYIGETTRHLSTRCEEHISRDKQSHIYKHIHRNIECFDSCNKDCFSILDTASTKFQLKLKEGMYIGWENTQLNKQVKYVSTSLSI